MKSITEKAKFCKRVVEYAIKENLQMSHIIDICRL